MKSKKYKEKSKIWIFKKETENFFSRNNKIYIVACGAEFYTKNQHYILPSARNNDCSYLLIRILLEIKNYGCHIDRFLSYETFFGILVTETSGFMLGTSRFGILKYKENSLWITIWLDWVRVHMTVLHWIEHDLYFHLHYNTLKIIAWWRR